MPSPVRKSRSSPSSPQPAPPAGPEQAIRPLRRVALAEMKDDFSRYLRLAARQRIVITRHGQPAGVLIGFASAEDWLDYRLATDPAFLQRVASASARLGGGEGRGGERSGAAASRGSRTARRPAP